MLCFGRICGALSAPAFHFNCWWISVRYRPNPPSPDLCTPQSKQSCFQGLVPIRSLQWLLIIPGWTQTSEKTEEEAFPPISQTVFHCRSLGEPQPGTFQSLPASLVDPTHTWSAVPLIDCDCKHLTRYSKLSLESSAQSGFSETIPNSGKFLLFVFLLFFTHVAVGVLMTLHLHSAHIPAFLY